MTDPVPSPPTLLEPDRSVVALIDHQPQMFLGATSHEAAAVLNNAVALPTIAKLFNVPVILTSIGTYSSGELDPAIRAELPDQQPIERSWITGWEDPAFRDAIVDTGRDQLILAGLWTEACVSFPALSAREEGRDVFVALDASAGATPDSHALAAQRSAWCKPVSCRCRRSRCSTSSSATSHAWRRMRASTRSSRSTAGRSPTP